MGLCYNIAFIFLYDKIYPETCEINAILEIVSIREEKENYNKYIVKVIENKKIKYSKKTKLILYIDEEFLPGDIIRVFGKFEKGEIARNYKGFNYRKYLKTMKIHGVIYANSGKILKTKNDFTSIIEKIRLNISNKIYYIYKKEYGEFLNGILIGKADEIDEKIKNSFRDSNISHILAISGLHVSYIVLGINFLLNKLFRSKKTKNIIMIITLFLVVFLTGFSTSCIRACIMSSMILIAFNLNRKDNFYRNFLFSFICIILINPFNIYSIGMWLSFMGTLGIVIFNKIFFKLCKINIKKIKIKTNYLKIIKKILEIISVTISAQILIIPIMIYSFNTISLSFIIPNFLISFFIGPILALGYISIFFYYVKFPFINCIIFLEEKLIFTVFKISEICNKIPFSKIYVSTPSLFSVILFYIFILVIIYLFKKRKLYYFRLLISIKFLKKEIKKILNNKKIINKQKIIISIFIILLIISNKNLKRNLKIYFVDVGQGDCTVIVTPSGKNILIDAGEGNTDKYDYGEKVVLPYLLDRKIKKIDYMIISHCDSDHIGGCFAILENLKVQKVFLGVQPKISKQLEDLIKISKKKNIEIVMLEKGNKIKIEKEIIIDVLSPNKQKLITENNLNNNSLLIKLKYNDFSMLFTGDIEEIAEKQILDEYKNSDILKTTILKVAHHGSKTSSIQEFINEVKPKIALIGVGKNNKFGHPNEDVLERLELIGARIYRNDESGEINIFVNKKGNIKTKKFIK